MAGIDTGGPGFGRLLIAPRPGGGIRFVKASYDSIRGRIEVRWEDAPDALRVSATLPANTTARVVLPARPDASVSEGGGPVRQADGVRSVLVVDEGGSVVIEVGSGSYDFTVRK